MLSSMASDWVSGNPPTVAADRFDAARPSGWRQQDLLRASDFPHWLKCAFGARGRAGDAAAPSSRTRTFRGGDGRPSTAGRPRGTHGHSMTYRTLGSSDSRRLPCCREPRRHGRDQLHGHRPRAAHGALRTSGNRRQSDDCRKRATLLCGCSGRVRLLHDLWPCSRLLVLGRRIRLCRHLQTSSRVRGPGPGVQLLGRCRSIRGSPHHRAAGPSRSPTSWIERLNPRPAPQKDESDDDTQPLTFPCVVQVGDTGRRNGEVDAAAGGGLGTPALC